MALAARACFSFSWTQVRGEVGGLKVKGGGLKRCVRACGRAGGSRHKALQTWPSLRCLRGCSACFDIEQVLSMLAVKSPCHHHPPPYSNNTLGSLTSPSCSQLLDRCAFSPLSPRPVPDESTLHLRTGVNPGWIVAKPTGTDTAGEVFATLLAKELGIRCPEYRIEAPEYQGVCRPRKRTRRGRGDGAGCGKRVIAVTNECRCSPPCAHPPSPLSLSPSSFQPGLLPMLLSGDFEGHALQQRQAGTSSAPSQRPHPGGDEQQCCWCSGSHQRPDLNAPTCHLPLWVSLVCGTCFVFTDMPTCIVNLFCC